MTPPRHQPAVPLVDRAPSPGVEPSGIPPAFRWSMKDELTFLRGLGHWRELECAADRAQLLRGYLEGLALRRRWTDLQREPLECEATLLLEELAGGRSVRKSA